jgi:hypothetical protein
LLLHLCDVALQHLVLSHARVSLLHGAPIPRWRAWTEATPLSVP